MPDLQDIDALIAAARRSVRPRAPEAAAVPAVPPPAAEPPEPTKPVAAKATEPSKPIQAKAVEPIVDRAPEPAKPLVSAPAKAVEPVVDVAPEPVVALRRVPAAAPEPVPEPVVVPEPEPEEVTAEVPVPEAEPPLEAAMAAAEPIPAEEFDRINDVALAAVAAALDAGMIDPAGIADAPAPAAELAALPAELPERRSATQFDQVDGLLGRVEAALHFVESSKEHHYERDATSRLLREAADCIRALREKRDHNHQQMERWFGRWRNAELQSLELMNQVKHLTAIQDQQTSLLLMARRLRVQEGIHVEWRAENAWVVSYEGHVLNAAGEWEPEQPEAEDSEYVTRTRYTLAEAVTRARALRLVAEE